MVKLSKKPSINVLNFVVSNKSWGEQFYMNRISLKNLGFTITAGFIALLLVSCHPENATMITHNAGNPPKSFEQLLAGANNTEQKQRILEGMQALRSRDYDSASRIFNELLTTDPTNSGLHTLNALSYQLRAKTGDFPSYDLAEAGYLQAKKFNPSNVYASLQLGRVKVEKKDYVGAQEEFAEVLLYDPQNEDALYELASVSYSIGDVKTARMSIDSLLKYNQTKPEYVRAGALIHAVQGNQPQAQKLLALYQTIEPKQKNKRYLAKRLNDWSRLHETGNIVMANANGETSPALIQAQALVPGGSSAPLPGVMITPAPKLQTEPNTQVMEPRVMTEGSAADAPSSSPPPVFAEPQGGMVVVDAVILRIMDDGLTSKGHNILENFTLTLAPFTKYFAGNAGSAISGVNVFPLNNISTGAMGSNASTSTSIPGTVSSMLPNLHNSVALVTSAISFGAINYSLNIANVLEQHIEIIGRPTLTSHVGKPSEFFNGQQLNIALTSTFGGGSINQIPTGSTLRVTPTSIDDGYVTLNVEVIDSFLKQSEKQIVASVTPNAPLVFAASNSDVKTTVKAKLGDTIILGGTVERHDISTSDGFPVLKDIPIVQYLFSSQKVATSRSSVLYLLTPRSFNNFTKSTKKYLSQKYDPEKCPNLAELAKRHQDWFDPHSNIIPILRTFGPMYQDFRLGDILPLGWTAPPTFDEKLYDLMDFLWD